MSYEILARREDREILKIIDKMLKIKEGDKLVLDLKGDTVVIKKFDDSVPISCKNLKPAEIGERLKEAIESVENGELVSEQEVWNNLEEIRL